MDQFAAPQFSQFPSRRSVVHSTRGIVACTQPLAAAVGQRVLQQGGNAADAAVAVAAALNVTEPTSTGIGGDAFCLFYDAKTKQVRGLNASGRAPSAINVETIRNECQGAAAIPDSSVHSITVPGAAAGWVDTVERFGSGKLSMADILSGAVDLAETGFPVSELTSVLVDRLRNASPNFAEMLKADAGAQDGVRAPKPGELFRNPGLARTMRTLASEGKAGFYKGPVAQAIVDVVQARGGSMTLDDLQSHLDTGSENTDPISIDIPGPEGPDSAIRLWEHPPNGQGIVALMTLGILQVLETAGRIKPLRSLGHNSSQYLHSIISALQIAFADAAWWVTDPAKGGTSGRELLDPAYLESRSQHFHPDRAPGVVAHGSPALSSSDTVYLAVTDSEGNAASFINSNYDGFGSAVIPKGCGFTLQNRGSNFSLQEGHPNVIAPGKRPYHTIIPAMVTNVKDSSLHAVFGVMGAFMQPQGHVQVLLNMHAFRQTPQAALDAPRICISADPAEKGGMTVWIEEGIEQSVIDDLSRLGHNVKVLRGYHRAMFGRGQVIRSHVQDGVRVYSAGSDPRGDGAAIPL